MSLSNSQVLALLRIGLEEEDLSGKKKANRRGWNLKTHGMAYWPEYVVWRTMKCRCNNPNATGYENYGGKGISVCAQWMASFEQFINDVGRRPHPSLTLERNDNSGNYEPGNCRWATRKEQSRNNRRSRLVTFNGETLPVVVWSERTGVNQSTLYKRLNKGWSVKRALSEETDQRFSHAPGTLTRPFGHI